jgi:hypothetical protein
MFPVGQSGARPHFQPEILRAATRVEAGLASKLTQIQPLGVSQIPAEKCQQATFAATAKWPKRPATPAVETALPSHHRRY